MSIFDAKNRIQWQFGGEALPIRTLVRGSMAGGLFLVLSGLVWDGFLTAGIVVGTLQEGFRPGLALVMGVMSLGGFGFIYFGLLQLRGQREIFIDGETVRVRQRGLLQAREWSEPLAAYRGVLGRVRRMGGSRSGAGTALYEVVLHHQDPSRAVVLFRSAGGVGIEELHEKNWRRFSELLGVPALRESSAGITEVKLGEPGSSWLQREAGDGHPGGDLSSLDLGRAVAVEWKEGAWHLTYDRARAAWRPLLGFIVSAAMLATGLVLRSADPGERGLWVFCAMMAAFSVLMLAGLIRDLVTVEQLWVSPDGVAFRSGRRGGSGRDRFLTLDEITDLRVGGGPASRRRIEALEITARSPGGRIVFGSGLPGPLLHLLQRALTAYFTGTAMPGAVGEERPRSQEFGGFRAARPQEAEKLSRY